LLPDNCRRPAGLGAFWQLQEMLSPRAKENSPD
jgi:hypothetical protein